MVLIVGLGNPGREYAMTRHNAGFMVVDEIAKRLSEKWSMNSRLRAEIVEANVDGNKVILAKPTTYMNRSGEAVQAIAHAYGVTVKDIWITYDEVALPIGTLRIRLEGSAGGHNGLKSLIAHLGTEAFPRFRVGIGPQPELVPLEDFVLGRFSADEKLIIDKTVQSTADKIIAALTHGISPTTE